MNFIVRNLLRTALTLFALLAYIRLDPQTAEWHDLLRLALQAAHSFGNLEAPFAVVFLVFCGAEWVLSDTRAVSVPAFSSKAFSVNGSATHFASNMDAVAPAHPSRSFMSRIASSWKPKNK